MRTDTAHVGLGLINCVKIFVVYLFFAVTKNSSSNNISRSLRTSLEQCTRGHVKSFGKRVYKNKILKVSTFRREEEVRCVESWRTHAASTCSSSFSLSPPAHHRLLRPPQTASDISIRGGGIILGDRPRTTASLLEMVTWPLQGNHLISIIFQAFVIGCIGIIMDI